MAKGGSTTSSVTVPEYIEDAARSNLAEAEKIRKIGYVPNYGPEVAAFTPMQQAAFQNTADTASAFGTAGGNMSQQDIRGGMPEATTYAGGVRGYSSAPIFEQSLRALGENRPGQKAAIDNMFIDPFSGVAGSNLQSPIDYTPVSGDLGGISRGETGGGGGGGGGGGNGGGGVGVGGGGTFLGGDYLGGSEIAETSLINSDLTDDQFFDIFESGDGVPAVSVGSGGTPGSWTTDQELYGAPGGFYGGSAANETALINSNLSDEDFWDTFEAGSPTSGLVTGGGADNQGNLGQVGDFFGGIGDSLGITNFDGKGTGLLSGLNLTGPVTPKSASELQFEADRAPGGIHYEGGGADKRAQAEANANAKLADAAAKQSLIDNNISVVLPAEKTISSSKLKDKLEAGYKPQVIDGKNYLVSGGGTAIPINDSAVRRAETKYGLTFAENKTSPTTVLAQ